MLILERITNYSNPASTNFACALPLFAAFLIQSVSFQAGIIKKRLQSIS